MRGLLFMVLAVCSSLAGARAEPLAIVAAENFYGDVAGQIGGPSVPVVGISETEPTGKTFQDWMMSQLVALETGLAGK